MKQNKSKMVLVVFFIFIFVFFFIFFTKVHPIILFDTDDWCYSFFSRVAYPARKLWNPTRILPETIMPIVLLFGNIILSIVSDNFITNTIIINAITVSFFILLYIYSFYNLLKNKLNLKTSYNICILILFILLHFLIFRSANINNNYMFYSLDACCYYYYLIPGLLNASLVMNYMVYDKFYFKNKLIITSLLFLMCYLAIFSNVFHSIILATFVGARLLFKIIQEKILSKNNFKIQRVLEFIKKNIFELIILISWVLVQLFEIGGGRAKSLESNNSFFILFKNSVSEFIKVFNQFNGAFTIILIVSLVIGIYLLFKNKLYKILNVKNSLLALFLSIVYLLLLCSKAGTWYITRPDVLIGIFFYLFILICLVFAYLIKKYNELFILLPTILFILLFEINTSTKTFKEPNVLNIDHQNVIYINEKIVSQIKDASVGKTKVIYIPKFTSNDNWPIANYGTNWIVESLYKHGVINNIPEVVFEINEDYFKEIMR